MASVAAIFGVGFALMFIGCFACLSLYVSLHKNSATIYPI
tara:strand:+ start:4934 stop:5053 length:120 start_codon:yes stop_codon:yes gene_type:complete